jgi:hypothetical protein
MIPAKAQPFHAICQWLAVDAGILVLQRLQNQQFHRSHPNQALLKGWNKQSTCDAGTRSCCAIQKQKHDAGV